LLVISLIPVPSGFITYKFVLVDPLGRSYSESVNTTCKPSGDTTGELTFLILYRSAIVNAFFCEKADGIINRIMMERIK
jgi:hypothetical protein